MSYSFIPIRLSLRQKLTVFISMLIIGACCSLSWYLIDQQTHTMKTSLIRTGTLVAERLSVTSRFSIISQDHLRLSLLAEGALTIPEVTHVRFLGPNGTTIVEKQKNNSGALLNLPTPSNSILSGLRSQPLITPYQRIQGKAKAVDTYVTTADLIMMAIGTDRRKTFIEVIQPISEFDAKSELAPTLLEELKITSENISTNKVRPQSADGYVQLCISTQAYEEVLLVTIRQVLLITLFIILIALGVTIHFAKNLVKPLQALAALATRVSKGDLTATVPSTTNDEIGDLAHSFNHMVQSLDHRDVALARQFQRLSTLNETSTAITSSLDPDTVLDRVLDLLVKNSGFQRTLLMRFDSQQQRTFDARVAGVSPDIAKTARTISITIHHDDSLLSEVVYSGKKILIPDLEAYADRMDPHLYKLAKHMEATSFILVPLTSQHRIVGFAGASRGPTLCSQEDLELLSTIGNQVGIAIDNAEAYQQLEHMMATLEQRVLARTTELRNANEKLKELDQLKSAMVRSVSHELRTPLASVKMHVDNLLDGGTGSLQEEQKDVLRRVQNSTERLRRMINEMLDLSKIESGDTTLNQTVVCFHEVLSAVIKNLQPLMTSRHLDIEVQRHPGLPRLWVDKDKLHQILMNLIHNAVKFSPEQSTIHITTDLKQESIQICIADEGNGVTSNELEHIFLPFYRSSTTAFPNRGAGLGLTISKSLIEMHGGKLWVQSIAGQGSQFFFTIPLANTPAHSRMRG